MKIDLSKSKKFQAKSKKLQKLILKALSLIEDLGIPLEDCGARKLEMMTLSFLVVIGKTIDNSWVNILSLDDGISFRTREIINVLNKSYEENISSGSYDDVRRKHLKLLTTAGIVVNSAPNTARNDSTRGYALNPKYKDLISSFGSDKYLSLLKQYKKHNKSLKDKLQRKRNLKPIKVKLPNKSKLSLTDGEHNLLQKAIIEELLPLYGHGAELLYVGDTSDKFLFLNDKKLKDLNFFEIAHAELPDILAYSKERNWLYLIEAVHSSGPISEIRLLELQKLTAKCTAEMIYITAFLDRTTFRKFAKDLAWETEVWIAESPEHMIHFNGDKFMGPYKSCS